MLRIFHVNGKLLSHPLTKAWCLREGDILAISSLKFFVHELFFPIFRITIIFNFKNSFLPSFPRSLRQFPLCVLMVRMLLLSYRVKQPPCLTQLHAHCFQFSRQFAPSIRQPYCLLAYLPLSLHVPLPLHPPKHRLGPPLLPPLPVPPHPLPGPPVQLRLSVHLPPPQQASWRRERLDGRRSGGTSCCRGRALPPHRGLSSHVISFALADS